MKEVGAYLKDVPTKAFLIVIIGDLMRFVLIYYENIIVVHVVYLTADKEALASRQAEKDLTAIVDMYIGISISVLGIIYAEARVITSMGDCERTAFKYAFHYVSHFLFGITNCNLWGRPGTRFSTFFEKTYADCSQSAVASLLRKLRGGAKKLPEKKLKLL